LFQTSRVKVLLLRLAALSFTCLKHWQINLFVQSPINLANSLASWFDSRGDWLIGEKPMFPIVPYVVQKISQRHFFWLNFHFLISDKELELTNLLRPTEENEPQ